MNPRAVAGDVYDIDSLLNGDGHAAIDIDMTDHDVEAGEFLDVKTVVDNDAGALEAAHVAVMRIEV